MPNKCFKKGLVVGIIILFVCVSVLSSVSSKSISTFNEKILEYAVFNVRQSQSSDNVELELQLQEIDSYLSAYGLDTRNTMGKFEQVMYNLVSKRKWRNPSLAEEMLKELDELSEILEQIGVIDDMTIAEAIPVIKNNKEFFQAEGKNLFCTMDIELTMGGCIPIMRVFNAMYGIWGVDKILDDTSYVRIKGISGFQNCEGWDCAKDYEGRFICLIGFNPPVMLWNYQVCTRYMWIRGFVYYSESNVPFVNSTSNSQQFTCPCNQQGNGVE